MAHVLNDMVAVFADLDLYTVIFGNVGVVLCRVFACIVIKMLLRYHVLNIQSICSLCVMVEMTDKSW